MSAIDFASFPHIVLAILDASPPSTMPAWRATSRFFRDVADEREAAERLIVDTRASAARLTLLTRYGHVPASLAAWPALHDPGLGADDADGWSSGSEYVPSEEGDDDEMDLDETDLDEMDFGGVADTDPEADGMDVDGAAQLRTERRRALAELREVEECARCQAWEAAILNQLPEAMAWINAPLQYAASLEDHKHLVRCERENEQMVEFDRERFGHMVDPDPDVVFEPLVASPPPPPPTIEPLPLLPEEAEEVEHPHEHPHEAAHPAYWAARAVRHNAARDEFANTVARTRVLDIPGPAQLHDLEHFTGLEVVRYVGRRDVAPAWFEVGAPTLVRFLNIVPPPGKWWEPVGEDDDQDKPCLPRQQLSAASKPIRKIVLSLTYHPEHPLLSSSLCSSDSVVKFLPSVKEVTVILVPSAAPAPDEPIPAEFGPGHPYRCKYEPDYDGDEPTEDLPPCVCRGLVTRQYFGPVMAVIHRVLYNHYRILQSWVASGEAARPRMTVVGLEELGNANLNVADLSWLSYYYDTCEKPFEALSTVERMYCLAAWQYSNIDASPDTEFEEFLETVRQFVRFISRDEYRAEVGERQFRLETVPPALPGATHMYV